MEEFLGGSPCLLDCLCFSYKNEAVEEFLGDSPYLLDCLELEEFLGDSPCLLDCLCFSYKNEAKRGRILRRQSLSSGLSML